MPNMRDVISNQNKSIVQKNDTRPRVDEICNCRNKRSCPLEGKCTTAGVIYQAKVTREDTHKKETYIGVTEPTFKYRYNNHTHSFREEEKKNVTTLSSYIWSLKNKNVSYSIKWKIIARGRAYSASTNKCNLCLKEKYFIICKPQMATLKHSQ